MLAKRVIKVYRDDWIGKEIRKQAEEKLFADGYYVLQEERVSEWSSFDVCCWLMLFFPLVFLAKKTRVKVTYELTETNV